MNKTPRIICLLLEAPANGVTGQDSRVLEYAISVEEPTREAPNGRFNIEKVRDARTLRVITNQAELPPVDAVRTAMQTEVWAAENRGYFDDYLEEGGCGKFIQFTGRAHRPRRDKVVDDDETGNPVG